MYKHIFVVAVIAAIVTALCIGCVDMEYTIEINESPAGSGTVSREPNKTSYMGGETVTVTAVASDGYRFVSWSGALNETDASVTFTINSNLHLTANFEWLGVTPPDSSVNPQDTTRPPEVDGLVGDWFIVDETIHSNMKVFYSFTASGDFVTTVLEKVSDFWIEGIQQSGRYTIDGDGMITAFVAEFGDDTGKYDIRYSISGDTLALTIINGCYYDDEWGVWECYQHGMAVVGIRDNIATVKKSLGKVYSQDPALLYTTWERSSKSDYEKYLIRFDSEIGSVVHSFGDYDGVYISGDGNSVIWYTENSRLSLIELDECAQYETVSSYEYEYEYEQCVSYSVARTVTLDYQLTNGTLLLRPNSSSEWDVWTPYVWEDPEPPVDLYRSKKSKATPKMDKRDAMPFFKALRW